MDYFPYACIDPGQLGVGYIQLCHARRQVVAAFSSWLRELPLATDIEAEIAGTASAMRQLADLAKVAAP